VTFFEQAVIFNRIVTVGKGYIGRICPKNPFFERIGIWRIGSYNIQWYMVRIVIDKTREHENHDEKRQGQESACYGVRYWIVHKF
jgi:hypothetical protein